MCLAVTLWKVGSQQNNVQEALRLANTNPISIQMKTKKPLKRKVGYGEDEVATHRSKKSKITDGTEPMVEDYDEKEDG